MKVTHYPNKEAWFIGRKGRITGSALKKIVPTGSIKKEQLLVAAEVKGVEFKKSWTIAQLNGLFTNEELRDLELASMLTADRLQGYYKVIADRLTINEVEETALEHGNRIEAEAMVAFVEKTGLKVSTDLVIWERDDNSGIAVSPDGQEDAKKVTFAVETKCLASENHIKAILTDTLPEEFDYQKKQYFACNDDLQTLYFVLYDPRFIKDDLKLKIFEIKRADVQAEVEMLLKFQQALLADIELVIEKLTY